MERQNVAIAKKPKPNFTPKPVNLIPIKPSNLNPTSTSNKYSKCFVKMVKIDMKSTKNVKIGKESSSEDKKRIENKLEKYKLYKDSENELSKKVCRGRDVRN